MEPNKEVIDINDKSLPRDLRRMIRKIKRARIGEIYGPECQEPVDDIIVRCIRIQRLLDSSSETIRKFTEDIAEIHKQMEEYPRPSAARPVRTVDSNGKYVYSEKKKAFDHYLDYSDVSDTEGGENHKEGGSRRKKIHKEDKQPYMSLRDKCIAYNEAYKRRNK